jgi:hypothetical protein
MPQRITHDGSGVTITEFDLRYLNADGESVDVDHFETKLEAIRAARKYAFGEEVVALVVEKHVSKHPAHWHDQPRAYTTVLELGNADALAAWNS